MEIWYVVNRNMFYYYLKILQEHNNGFHAEQDCAKTFFEIQNKFNLYAVLFGDLKTMKCINIKAVTSNIGFNTFLKIPVLACGKLKLSKENLFHYFSLGYTFF